MDKYLSIFDFNIFTSRKLLTIFSTKMFFHRRLKFVSEKRLTKDCGVQS